MLKNAEKKCKMIGVSFGIVFIMYMLNMFSTMAEEVSFLKYFSLFTLADIRNVIIDVSINPVMVLISISLSILFLGLTLFKYSRKELV